MQNSFPSEVAGLQRTFLICGVSYLATAGKRQEEVQGKTGPYLQPWQIFRPSLASFGQSGMGPLSVHMGHVATAPAASLAKLLDVKEIFIRKVRDGAAAP